MVSKAVASLRDTRRLYAEQSEVGRMWMDSNLEHTVKFTEEVETTSYTWCLRELNKDGNKIGYDQIPWEFDAEFSVAEQNAGNAFHLFACLGYLGESHFLH